MMATRIKPPIGLLSSMALVVASMIGAGIFTTSGFALQDLGSREQVMLAWCVGSFIAMCGAISYGSLCRHWTESGGEYLFLSRAVHPWAGFLAGWVSLLAGFTSAIAFSAVTLEAYVRPWLPGSLSSWFAPGMIAVLVVLAGGCLHGIHREAGIVGQNLLVAVKLILISAFIVWGAVHILRQGASDRVATGSAETIPFSLQAFATSLVWISLSFSGFNAAVYVAGESINAQKNVPQAMLAATFLVSLFYLGLNAIYLWGAPADAIRGQQDVAAVAATAMGGPRLGAAMRGLIAWGLLSSVASMVMAGPRVYAQMARDGLFPRWFRQKDGAPTASIALQVLLAAGVAYSSSVRQLLSYLGFTLSLSSAAAVAAVLTIPFSKRDSEVRTSIWDLFRLRIIPMTYIAATGTLALIGAFREPWQFAASILTFASGTLVYAILVRTCDSTAVHEKFQRAP